MNYRYFIKVILLLLFCGCIFYLIRSRCFAEKSILADDELRTAGDSLIALSVPQPLKYIKNMLVHDYVSYGTP